MKKQKNKYTQDRGNALQPGGPSREGPAISKIFKIFRRPTFPRVSKCWTSKNMRFTKTDLSKRFGMFLAFLRYPGVSKDKINGFLKKGHVQKNRYHRNEGFRFLP